MAWLLAPLYDRIVAPMEAAGLGTWRAELLAPLQGTVLEIGAGTGVNVERYPAAVAQLILTEPDPGMRKQLAARLAEVRDAGRLAPAVAEVRADPAGALTVVDGSVDAVVATLVLCTVPDPDAALAEAHRVLRPGGRLVFVEHVAADHKPDRLRWQRRVDPVWKRVAGGCRLTRTTGEAIERAGFSIDDVTRESARKASPLLRTMIRGTAVKPG